MNERKLRLLVFLIAILLHLLILFFLVFEVDIFKQEEPEHARIMKLTDVDILPPPEPDLPPPVEEIAENMIESETPDTNIVGAGTLQSENYLEMQYLSTVPIFDSSRIASDLIYPSIAERSGIEGRVILELFIDVNGIVKSATILREDPEGWGFGDAAVRALIGKQGTPATSNGENVSCRYRYPVTFVLR